MWEDNHEDLARRKVVWLIGIIAADRGRPRRVVLVRIAPGARRACGNRDRAGARPASSEPQISHPIPARGRSRGTAGPQRQRPGSARLARRRHRP